MHAECPFEILSDTLKAKKMLFWYQYNSISFNLVIR